jgi:hypothetical protein
MVAMNLRALVLARLEELGWSHYRLVQACAGRVSANALYAWLSGERDIRGESLGAVFVALGLELRERADAPR